MAIDLTQRLQQLASQGNQTATTSSRPSLNKTQIDGLSKSKYRQVTYNENFPWLNEASYKKLESAVDKMGLSWEEKQTAMNQWYRQNVKYLLNDQTLEERAKEINDQAFQAAELKNPQADAQLRMTEFSQALKKKYNLDATADDLEVFKTFVNGLWEWWAELAWQYLSWENKKLWYGAGLETFGEKVVDFGVGVLQSPWKWWYNMLWQRTDKAGKWIAEWAYNSLSDEAKQKVGNFINNLLWEENVRAYQEENKRAEEEWTLFSGREATDIRTPLLWEERANSKATKVGETVGDIATWIAMTAPAWALLAPTIAWSSVAWAAWLGAVEWLADTALTQYWSQWNLDLSAWQLLLGAWGWAVGWLLTRYLANLPAKQLKDIKTEAEWYIDKSIRPTVKWKQWQVAYDKFIDDTIDVTDWMSKNKDVLQYTDDAWEIVTWKLPTNLNQTREALGNAKKYIYDTYNNIAKQAWDAGARVDLNKVFNELDDLASDAASNIANPWLKSAIEWYKNQLLQYTDDLWRISIDDAQKLTQNYNKILEAYFKNPWAYANDTSRNIVIAQMNRWVKDAIDESIDDVLNSAIQNWSKASDTYKYWKQLYGKIKTIEDEVSKSALREMRKNSKWISTQVIDALAWEKLVEWLLTQSPTSLFKSIAMKGIDSYNKYLNSPNTQINNLFKLVDKVNNPSAITSSLTNSIGWPVMSASEALGTLWGVTTASAEAAGNIMGNAELD